MLCFPKSRTAALTCCTHFKLSQLKQLQPSSAAENGEAENAKSFRKQKPFPRGDQFLAVPLMSRYIQMCLLLNCIFKSPGPSLVMIAEGAALPVMTNDGKGSEEQRAPGGTSKRGSVTSWLLLA